MAYRASRCIVFMVAGLLSVFLLPGCAKDATPRKVVVPDAKPASSPQAIDWAFKPKAIPLHIQAEQGLNWYQGEPHVLKICVYQLSGAKKFDGLRKSIAGVQQLMQCRAAIDPEVALAQSWFIQPGQEKTFILDRAQGARYIGVVAGYFNQAPDQVSRILPYPVKVNTPISPVLFWQDKTYEPGHLTLSLKLFSAGIALTEATDDD
ncbi:MAG: type VI secretion lipoprotein TssJ [Hyphomicrobiales bacterium]